MKQWFSLYALSLIGIAFFSYIFVDPNLVLSGNAAYWGFQQWMWSLLEFRQLVGFGYAALIIVCWISYWQIVSSYFSQQPQEKKLVAFNSDAFLAPVYRFFLIRPLLRKMAIALAPMIFVFWGYNALSHDVFNYMFNSKMVIEYGANPHTATALDFASDTWTRFMHNTHTPAPYGYGWTALSLIPSYLGGGIFIITWLLFRLWAIAALALFVLAVLFWSKSEGSLISDKKLQLVFWNPLLVLEIGLNMHNDYWMLAPAAASLLLLKLFSKRRYIFASAVLLVVSIATKFATLVIIPFWFIGMRLQSLDFLAKYLPIELEAFSRFKKVGLSYYWAFVPLGCSILLFLPLLTARSKQYLPWYLLWSWSWLALSNQKVRKWWLFLTAATLAALLRYIPWILAGGFGPEVESKQAMLLWFGSFIGYVLLSMRSQKQYAI